MKNTKIHIEKASYGVIVGTSNPFLPEAALDPIQNNLYILPYNSTGTHWILSILGQLSFEHDVSGNNNDSESHFGCMFINPGRETIPLPTLRSRKSKKKTKTKKNKNNSKTTKNKNPDLTSTLGPAGPEKDFNSWEVTKHLFSGKSSGFDFNHVNCKWLRNRKDLF